MYSSPHVENATLPAPASSSPQPASAAAASVAAATHGPFVILIVLLSPPGSRARTRARGRPLLEAPREAALGLALGIELDRRAVLARGDGLEVDLIEPDRRLHDERDDAGPVEEDLLEDAALHRRLAGRVVGDVGGQRARAEHPREVALLGAALDGDDVPVERRGERARGRRAEREARGLHGAAHGVRVRERRRPPQQVDRRRLRHLAPRLAGLVVARVRVRLGHGPPGEPLEQRGAAARRRPPRRERGALEVVERPDCQVRLRQRDGPAERVRERRDRRRVGRDLRRQGQALAGGRAVASGAAPGGERARRERRGEAPRRGEGGAPGGLGLWVEDVIESLSRCRGRAKRGSCAGRRPSRAARGGGRASRRG